MPKLSFYHGTNQMSFAFEGEAVYFPYNYNPHVFSSSFSEQEFYEAVFSVVERTFNTDFSTNSVYVVNSSLKGFPQIETPFKIKAQAELKDTLPDNYLFVSYDYLATSHGVSASFPLSLPKASPDFFANFALLPSLTCVERPQILLKDSYVLALAQSLESPIDSSLPLVLTGDRIGSYRHNGLMTVVLVLNLINQEGIYQIDLDVNNIYAHTVFSVLNNSLVKAKYDFLPLGTLVNSPDDTEALFKPPYGAPQLVTLNKDNVYVLPLDAGLHGQLLVKNSKETFEKKVYGGSLGIIIDTRDKKQKPALTNIQIDMIDHQLKYSEEGRL